MPKLVHLLLPVVRLLTVHITRGLQGLPTGGGVGFNITTLSFHTCRADKEVLDLFPEAQRHAHQQQAQQPSQPQHEQQRVGVREGLWERLLAGLGPRHALMARIPLAMWEDLRQLRV